MGILDNLLQQSPEDYHRRAIMFNSMTTNPDPSYASFHQGQINALAQKKEDAANQEKQQAINSRTEQWLLDQGRDDLAQLLATGAIGGKEAITIAMQKPKEAKRYVVNGNLVDEQGMSYFTAPSEKDGKLDIKDRASIGSGLRKDLRKDLDDYNLSKTGWENIQTFFDNPGSVSDYALAVGFAKILDPGSVAREGEVNAVANSGAVAPAIKTSIINALTGKGKLDEKVRNDIMNLSTKIFTKRAKDAQGIVASYRDTANSYTLDFNNIYHGGKIELPEPIKRNTPPAVVDKFNQLPPEVQKQILEMGE